MHDFMSNKQRLKLKEYLEAGAKIEEILVVVSMEGVKYGIKEDGDVLADKSNKIEPSTNQTDDPLGR